MRVHAERDMRMSIKSGAVSVPSPGVALDLGYGLATMMLRRTLDGRINMREINAAGLMLLRAYGVPEAEAKRISHLPPPQMPSISLRTAVIENFQAD